MSTTQLLPADLMLVSGTSLLDRAIEDISHSEWSHVAGFVRTKPPDELIEAQGFRRVGYQDPGVYAGHSVIYRCDALTETQRRFIVKQVQHCIGMRYDYIFIFWELVRYTTGLVVPWYEFHTRVCSSLWADAYMQAGIDLCPGIRYPSPGDLALSDKLRPVCRYV